MGIAAAGLLASAPSTHAQEGDSLATGVRYRITLPKLSTLSGPQFPGTRWLTGELTERRGDSLVVRPHPTASTVSVPLASVDRLERSQGVSRLASGVEGAVVGAIFGVAVGSILYELGVRESGFRTWGQAVGTMAAHAGGGGLVTGLVLPSERWKRIRVPTPRSD